MARAYSLVIFAGLLLCATLSFAGGPVPNVPIYIRIDNGWKGLYAVGDDYAEYSFRGSEVKLQDPYHILLKPSVGMMVTFADKQQFASSNDLLSDHLQWELAYWGKNASRVESAPRDDLSGMRSDLKVTELRLYNSQGARLNVYLIALACPQGVLAFAVSPADGSIDPQIREIAASFKLVHRRLDADEVKRLSLEERGKP